MDPQQPPQPVGQVVITLLADGDVQVQARVPGTAEDVVRLLAAAQLAVLDEARRQRLPQPVIEVPRPGLVNRLNGTH